MKIDFTITFALLLSLVTILANVITVLINNAYQLKIKKIDIYQVQKRETLEKFINLTIECYKNDNNWQQNKEFLKSIYQLQLYFKSANQLFIKAIITLLNSNLNESEFTERFSKVIIKLSNEVEKG